jgi:phospholipid transport system transporter-binding protein
VAGPIANNGLTAPAAPAASLREIAPGRFALSGWLGFATARAVHGEGRRVILAATTDLEFDCHGLTHTDSAGVAVLIDWLAAAKRRARILHYVGISDSVRAIARISEVDDLLESGV